jgi:hypothetical protein
MGGGGGGGGAPPGLALGDDCAKDADCDSGLCKPVLLNTGQTVCVSPCTNQMDCGGVGAKFFCDPLKPGSANGYCVPHSPAHCLSCNVAGDCGTLSEECFLAPGDKDKACHVDCALSGEDACPPEYTCTDETVNGAARKLCRPNLPTCIDAVGGYCDRVSIPQSCSRNNAAGQCVGERDCLVGSKRFDKCNAIAPQCKADCAIQDPAGCTEVYCPGATNTAQNCGMCGNACPGLNQPNDDVTCQNGQTCTFACQGENYDVDKNTATGCEKVDSPLANHTQGASVNLGQRDCHDNGLVPLTSGLLPSDGRTHANPAVVGFDGATGSAPDWFYVDATGGFCQNDVNADIQISNSSNPTCYKLSILTDKGTYVCSTNGAGNCSISNGSGSYGSGSQIFFKIEKTCGTNVVENPSYAVRAYF